MLERSHAAGPGHTRGPGGGRVGGRGGRDIAEKSHDIVKHRVVLDSSMYVCIDIYIYIYMRICTCIQIHT